MDLWAFDDDLDLEETQQPSKAAEVPARRGNKPAKDPSAEPTAENKIPPAGDLIRMNVGKPKFKARSGQPAGQSTPEKDFDDLEHWEDAPANADLGELPPEPAIPLPVPEVDAKADGPPAREPATQAAIEEVPADPSPAPAAQETAEDDEFSPVVRKDAVPVSLRPHLGLTKAERSGLIALVVVLVLAAAYIGSVSIGRLPTESTKASSTDFPIEGKHVKVASATSYWRPPITEGPDADTFRRGTALLPVVELKLERASGAIRVLFRNEDRQVVGDTVIRRAERPGVMKITATAGFDDPGMHAAYRTGGERPWTIEVMEAPSEDTPGREFKKLFEMNISAALR